jgi:hypothetical protein
MKALTAGAEAVQEVDQAGQAAGLVWFRSFDYLNHFFHSAGNRPANILANRPIK